MFLTRFFGRLWRRKSPAETVPESAPPVEAKPDDDDFDATWRAIMRKWNRPISDLKGDGTQLEALIKRVEQTAQNGELAMRGGRS
jgi:hypothetical protein